jgi:hypothetical protein
MELKLVCSKVAGLSISYVEPHEQDRPEGSNKPDVPAHATRRERFLGHLFIGFEGKVARASNASCELDSAEESKLLVAIAEAEQGETTSAADILKQIRWS